MFIVIEFSNGDVEVVPASWVKNNKVQWSRTAKSYALKNFQPKSSWKTYECKLRYKSKVFATYEEASEKCNFLLYNSESSDCNEGTEASGPRRKRTNQDSDYEYFEDNEIDDLPEPPSDNENIKPNEREKSNDREMSNDGDETLTPSKETFESGTFNSAKNSVYLGEADANGTINLSDMLFQPTCKCEEIKQFFQLEIENLKEEIARLTNAVKESSTLIDRFIIQSKREWEAVKFSISNNRSNVVIENPVNEELENIFQELIPLTSIDDIKVLNEILLENAKQAYFINKIKKIGGKDAKGMISNIIKCCFTVETQSKCNWTGANNKYRLRDTKFIEAVFKVVLDSEKTTRAEIEKHLKYIFQHTYDRVKSEAKQQRAAE